MIRSLDDCVSSWLPFRISLEIALANNLRTH
jgi:hypothetical protein